MSRTHAKKQKCDLLREQHRKRYWPEYRSWAAMMQRCFNMNCRKYPIYGARGITVCDRWMSFDAFISDMGRRPDRHTLGRINNNGDYTPENCRWETAKQQARNTRVNRLLSFNGKTQTVVEWAEELAVRPDFIHCRLNRGWSIERTITEPKHNRGVRHRRTT